MRIKICWRHGEALCAGVLFQTTVFWCVCRWVEMEMPLDLHRFLRATCKILDLFMVGMHGKGAIWGEAPKYLLRSGGTWIHRGPTNLRGHNLEAALRVAEDLKSCHGSK